MDGILENEPGLWKWLVLFAAFAIQISVSGIAYCTGLYYVIFKENIPGSSTSISLATSLNLCLSFGLGPIGGAMTERFGCRPVAILGSILGSVGLGLTAFATQPWHLVISFGILTGTGLGLTYIPATAAVPQYFRKHSSCTLAFANSGLGMGQLLSPLIVQQLTDFFGWRGGIVMITGLYLQTIVLSALLRPVTVLHQKSTKNKSTVADQENNLDNIEYSNKHHYILSVCNNTLLKDQTFMLFIISFLTISFGQSITLVHMGAYATTHNLNHDEVAVIFFFFGAIGIVSRWVTGLIAQVNCLGVLKLLMLSTCCCGISTLGFSYSNSLITCYISSTIMGIFFGFYGTLVPLATFYLVGVKRLASGFGFVCLACSVGFLTGGPFAGWVYDFWQHYEPAFYFASGIMIVSSVILIPVDYRQALIRGKQ